MGGAVKNVWIVSHEDSPPNNIIGVFATQSEAASFAEEMAAGPFESVIYSSFSIGYRYDRGTGHVEYGPDE